eukprot:1618964-Amphidinium_carterae.1
MKAHQTADGDAEEGRVDRFGGCGRQRRCQRTCALEPSTWPTVRLPAPKPEPDVVESERPARFPAEPFVCGPHLHVVEHETYASCVIVSGM